MDFRPLSSFEITETTASIKTASELDSIAHEQATMSAYAAQLEGVLAQMQANTALSQRATNRAIVAFVLLYGSFYGAVFLLMLGWPGILLGLSLLVALGSLFLYNLHLTYRCRQQSHALMAQISADVRAVGPLLSFMESQNKQDITLSIYSSLKQLLPRLTANDAILFSEAQMNILIKLLRHTVKRDIEIQLCVLKALEQIGDRRALDSVQRLAHSRTSALQNAARQCLPFLQLRAQEQERAQTLLRPSQADAIAPDLLLRPVMTPAEEDGAQLLRPQE